MPEILVLSGKGGTGKTSLTAAFAHLAVDAVVCDLDVDVPDLHLILKPAPLQTSEFYSGHEAFICSDLCNGCETCIQMCRFNAIHHGKNSPEIDALMCEGCGVCVAFCPSDAIALNPKHCGSWFVSETRFGPMVHAQLFPGEENSGRLVALLRQKAKEMAGIHGYKFILSDGPPGIGCPVISAASGVDLAVIVTEPTPSGFHDMERIVSLCGHFQIPVTVIVNKCDLNSQITQEIKTFCSQRGYCIAAQLPHDPVFVHAMVHGKTVTEYANGKLVRMIEKAWNHISSLSIAGFESKTRTHQIVA